MTTILKIIFHVILRYIIYKTFLIHSLITLGNPTNKKIK